MQHFHASRQTTRHHNSLLKPLFAFSIKLLIIIAISFLFILITTKPASAQAGQLDPSFNTTDNGFSTIEGADKDVRAIALQADGKIIIGGTFTSFSGVLVNRIARLNSNGSIDPAFNAGGTGVDSTVNKILIQPDGKIILGGFFNSFNGIAAPYLVRLNADGSRDAGFNTGTGPNGIINTLALDAAGKIVAAGKFTSYNGSPSSYLVRLNANGSKDMIFSGSTASSVNDLVIQADGKILVGINNDGNGLVTNFLKRLAANGVADPTFNAGQAGANNTVRVIRTQADGKILVGGDFSVFNDLSSNFTRINADGSLDPLFDNTSGGLPNGIKTITLQSDGKIIAGYGAYQDIYAGETLGSKLARLNADGTSDVSFKHDFYDELNENVYTILVQPDGKILVGETFITRWSGSISRYYIHAAGQVSPGMRDFKINRYNADGSRDQNFAVSTAQTGPNRSVLAIATQADGKTLIGGTFFSYNGAVSNYFARLNADGTKDAGFNAGGIGFNKKVNAIAVQPDGKIIAAGVFTKYNGLPVSNIIRLNTDGSRDLSFAATATEEIFSLKIQPDGKILAGGLNTLSRLNIDGSTDNTFSASVVSIYGNFFASVYSLALQPDGKILAGGDFRKINFGLPLPNLGRLKPDGSTDSSFAPYDGAAEMPSFSGTNGMVYTIQVQPDGRIIVGGSFTAYTVNSVPVLQNSISRITANGFIDTSFNQGGTGANAAINSVVLQPDGKMLIAGNFTSYNSVAVNRLARLNADGTLDAGFNPGGTGANSGISSLAFEANGRKFLIGGSFTSYNGTAKNRVVRINNCSGSTASITDLAVCSSQLPYTWNGNSFNAAGTYTVTLNNISGCDSLATLNLSVSASNISGPIRACAYIQPLGGTAIYSVKAPAGSTLTWSVSKPATMLISSGQGTDHIGVQYTSDFTSGNVYVRVINSACGIDIKKTLTVSRAVPSTPAGIIAATSFICPYITTGNGITYTIPKVAAATSYIWTAQSGTTTIYHPNGAGVNDTIVQISFAANFTNSPVTVQAVNDCGTSNVRSLTVKLSIPATPGTISGPSNVCEYMFPNMPTPAIYSVAAVADVLYHWSASIASPAPGNIINYLEHTNSIVTSFREDFTTGVMSVRASNGCGTSAARILNLKKLNASTPGAITTTNTGACPDRTHTYSIASTPANSTSVVWSVPAGATIQSGQGTNSISVSYPSTQVSGFISVQAFNNCSSSSVRKITISLAACPPVTPFARNGNNESTNAKSTIPELHFDLMEVKVFPNPTVSDFKLLVNTSGKEEIHVRIFEVQGRLIKEFKVMANQVINIGSELRTGAYMIEVRQGKNMKTTKVLKF